MNSLERREARYKRRKKKREDKNSKRNKIFCDIDKIFSFSKVMYYADKCCNGVGYKKSTQNFKIHMFTIIATTCRNIKTNNYKVGKTYKFQINERGKIRDIDAPHINDRLVHKVLANEVLLPIYSPHMIYDNGASMKNKGFLFCIDRVKYKLYNWYKKYGLNGYAVIIDFSKYFQNCSHDIIHNIHKKYIYDDYLIKVIEDYLFIGEGIALGVEIAQREACIVPNEILRDKYELKDGKAEKVSNGTKEYEKLLKYFDSVLSDYTLTDEEGKTVKTGEKRIYAPNFFYVEEGKVKNMISGISDKQTDARGELTEEILEDEEKAFRNFFNN